MHGLMRSLMPNKDGWRRSLYVACRFVFALEDIHIYISMDMYIEREMGIYKYYAESYAVTEVLCMSYAEPYAVLCGASTGLRAKWFPKPRPEPARIPTTSYAECYARPKAHKTFQNSCFRVYVLCAFDTA